MCVLQQLLENLPVLLNGSERKLSEKGNSSLVFLIKLIIIYRSLLLSLFLLLIIILLFLTLLLLLLLLSFRNRKRRRTSYHNQQYQQNGKNNMKKLKPNRKQIRKKCLGQNCRIHSVTTYVIHLDDRGRK